MGKNYREILSQFSASELLEMQKELEALTFVPAHDLVFGTYKKHFFDETYGWAEGGGYSRVDRYSWSEIFLYNALTKKDALTGEDLDCGYQTHFEDLGHCGTIYTFVPVIDSSKTDMTLENQGTLYEIPFQALYSDLDNLQLLAFYNSWREQKEKEAKFVIKSNNQNLILPIREYEIHEGNVVRALKPLQYFDIKR